VISGGLACVAGAVILGTLIPALRRSTLSGSADDQAADAEAAVHPAVS